MHTIKRCALHATAVTLVTWLSSQSVLAACNATVNGRPMTQQECQTAIHVYGRVVPGDYYADGQGNWANANDPLHRGNTYLDAQWAGGGVSGGSRGGDSYGGSWGGGSYTSPSGVYDASGGCEGGSCVNIID
jgi:hypothetical protein